MKLYTCQHCGQLIYFENTRCEGCGRRLGYLAEADELVALDMEGEAWRASTQPGRLYRFCANAAFDACNWLLSAAAEESFCLACRHNRTIPDLGQEENLLRWRRVEIAKHQLFYTLLRLGLPRISRVEDPEQGLAFDFLAHSTLGLDPAGRVMTGHERGLITINLEEADTAARERIRQEMGEPYRTLLGHLRHEIGHWYWDRMIRDGGRLAEFRALFGDENEGYAAALRRHYQSGPRPDWQVCFISAYASAHPWEDFAEIWAHYLHIVDTLETAAAFGLKVRSTVQADAPQIQRIDFDPHAAEEVDQLVEAWLPLAFAVNSINRSMGQPDLYPFILSPPVIDKLRFVHAVIRPPGGAGSQATAPDRGSRR